MSGEPVSGKPVIFSAFDETAFVVRAFRALQSLPPNLPPWALIGGVAVSVNLAGMHRPTGDLDSVSLDRDEAIAILTADGATLTTNGVAIGDLNATVEFDVIDVSIGDEEDGAFLAHRFALDTARAVRLLVVNRHSKVLVDHTIAVSTPGAIVAMKLHAIAGRRAQRPDKRSGDLFDIASLTVRHGASFIADELRNAPEILILGCAELVGKYFRSEVTATMRSLRTDSRDQVNALDLADLTDVAEIELLLRSLR